MKYIKRLFGFISSDNYSVDQKVESLRRMGINVAVISKNDKYKEGYILGKMKDKKSSLKLKI